jgi:hypothetical protein
MYRLKKAKDAVSIERKDLIIKLFFITKWYLSVK